MTSSSPVRIPSAVQIPELGPALGRIALPATVSPSDKTRFSLDSIRLELATAIFELTADARSWSSAGDRQAAVDALGRAAWLGAWDSAVGTAAEKAASEIDARISEAAEESRIPARRRKRLLLSDAEKRAITARLGRGGVALADGLDPLDLAGQRLREAGVLDREAGDRWRAALNRAAQTLEAAWLLLEDAAEEEWTRWSSLVESVRAWRRPRWILLAISLAVLALAIYVGLVVGGYLEGPPFLDAFAEWWWSWWDRMVEPA
jgi:hypothetical protein